MPAQSSRCVRFGLLLHSQLPVYVCLVNHGVGCVYQECEKMYNQEKFYAAIETEATAPFTMDPADIVVDDGYNGPRINEEDGVSVSLMMSVHTRD